jgi:hypothetical protein
MSIIMKQYSHTGSKIAAVECSKAVSERESQHHSLCYAGSTSKTDVSHISGKLPYYGWACLQ